MRGLGLIAFFFVLVVRGIPSQEVKRIAVIGAGIGGTSAAYFLKEFAPELQVTLYTKDPVGGRLATATIDGREYEVGGSILHPRNKYMRHFAEKFGFKMKKGLSGKFGLHDGSKFILKEGDWSLINFVKLVWRYGLSIPRISYIISDMLGKFEKIYHLQEEGHYFDDVTSLISAMDDSFIQLTNISLLDYLKSEQISDSFIQELAQAIMRVNYGQSVKEPAFVGSVSLAGAEPNLWAVHGGNKRIPIALLNASQANLVSAVVDSITLELNGQFSIKTTKSESHEVYEAVIIAAPLTSDQQTIRFKGFPRDFDFSGKFHRTVCTMVHGDLNQAFFGKDGAAIDEILTVKDGLWFNSIGRNYPVDVDDNLTNIPSLWKVFSNDVLTEEQLNLLFSGNFSIHLTDWAAYPAYSTKDTLGKFTLYPGLYYLNAIEWAASAMEMSVIGAKNSALLAVNHLKLPLKLKLQNGHFEL